MSESEEREQRLHDAKMARLAKEKRDADLLVRENERLWSALEQLVTLQAHYAKLLNGYDGGERHEFEDAHEWVNRLDELDKLPRKEART